MRTGLSLIHILHAQLRSYYDMFYTLGELRGGTQRVGTSSLNTSLNYADGLPSSISTLVMRGTPPKVLYSMK